MKRLIIFLACGFILGLSVKSYAAPTLNLERIDKNTEGAMDSLTVLLNYTMGDTIPVVWDSTLAAGDSITFVTAGNGFWPTWGSDVNATMRIWIRALATAINHKV